MARAPDNHDPNGIAVDLLSRDRLESMPTMEKIRSILDRVRDDKVVILEGGLDPEEESKLIETTMSEITHDEFTGIEIEKLPNQHDSSGVRKRLGRMISGDEDESDVVLIGPSDRLQTIKKDEAVVSTLLRGSRRRE